MIDKYTIYAGFKGEEKEIRTQIKKTQDLAKQFVEQFEILRHDIGIEEDDNDDNLFSYVDGSVNAFIDAKFKIKKDYIEN